MPSSWKPTAFVLLVSLAPPLGVVAFFVNGKSAKDISLAWGSLLGVCYLWLLVNYTFEFFASPLNKLPLAPNVSFLLGHGYIIINRPPGALFLKWMRDTPNEGLIRWYDFFFTSQRLLLTSPEALKEVMNDKCYDYEKPVPPKRFLSWIIGEGLLLVEGHEHKTQRKAVTPAFHGSHIKELVPLFWRKSVQFTDVLSSHLSMATDGLHKYRDGVLEVNAVGARATLDIIGLAGLGRDFNSLAHDQDVLAKQFSIITNTEDISMVAFFIANMVLPPWLVRLFPWKIGRIFREATAAFKRSSINLLEEKKVEMRDQKPDQVDILSTLMRSTDTVPDDLLLNQLRTFLAAGSETTSSALAWVFYLLSIHPTIQSDLRTALQAHLTTSESNPTLDISAIEQIPLLHAVCNETLRLYPTVPTTSRVAMRPTTILGHPIPKGTNVFLIPWAINRLPALWGPDADEFRPERWIGENNAPLNGGAAAGPYSFITFLHGPRSCIGQGFARVELKCLVAATVLRFHMEMADKNEVLIPAGTVTIKPKNGLRLRLREL